jgi:hypothetical protein
VRKFLIHLCPELSIDETVPELSIDETVKA